MPLSLKTILLRSTMLVGAVALAAPALAQVTPGTPAAGNATPGSPAEAAPNPEGEREITVTGSLIRNPNLVRATPVIVTTSEEIELRQSNVAEDVLREIPGVLPSIGSAVNNGNGGQSFVDLRGIGSQRNLVLLDGNRIVPGDVNGRVDLNNIPLALVDRVESLTGAASTTYGADAISGVVNFITKKNFTGVDISGSEQITEKGDGNYYRTDATIGGNFADDKGNAVLSVGYQHADPVYQGDRNFSVRNISSFTGGAGGSGTYVPSGFTGTRPIDATTGLPSIDPATANGGKRQINPTTGQAVASYAPFNFNPYNIFQTPFKRFNIYGQANYEASEHFEFYTRALFSKNTVNTILAPAGIFGASVVIPLSNPYLPAALRNQFCAYNISATAGTYVPFLTPAQCGAAALATSPTNPDGSTNVNFRTTAPTAAVVDPVTGKNILNGYPGTVVSRRSVENGPRISDFTSTVFDYRAGVRGKINSHLDYDISGSYGESSQIQTIGGYLLTDRIRSAAYATNTTSCLTTNLPAGAASTPGCVPVNLFGPAGSITANQLSYLAGSSTVETRSQLGQVHAQISGDFGVTSPAATDPISFAVGAEYRKYKASQIADVLSQTPGELSGTNGSTPSYTGGYNVIEGFGELIVPLVQDKPGIESLTADGGIRYSAYHVDAAGSPSYNTTTYKGELAYAPGFGLKFRGNYAHAVRAPSIFELFNPVTTGLTNLSNDPCASLTNTGKSKGRTPTGTLATICLAQGANQSNIGSIQDPSSNQPNLTTGGNTNIKPETADTFGGGVVFAPKFFSGFSTSVDYYHIRVVGAISSFTPGDLITGCFHPVNGVAQVTAADVGSLTCTAFKRNPATGGLDGDPSTTPGLITAESNFGKITTEGVDVTINYSRDLHFAKLGLSFLGNYTAHNRFQATPISLNRDCVGYFSVNCPSPQPKFQWSQRTTLSFNSFDVSLLWRHIDKLNQEPDDVQNGNGPAFSGTLTDRTWPIPG